MLQPFRPDEENYKYIFSVYGSMHCWERVLYSVITQDEALGDALEEALDDLNVPVSEFCGEAGISESTMYKIMSGHRENIQIQNFKSIVVALRRLEQDQDPGERSVAVITNRESLENTKNRMQVRGYEVTLHGYPCSTVEEAIRQSILAERDGVDSIICGPITAYTVENIVHIPVVGLDVRPDQVKNAVETAINKLE